MHIITMTKQDTAGSLAPVPVDSAGAGAPGSRSFGASSSPPGGVTREMREAGAEVIQNLCGVVDSYCLAVEVYNAMAAAAEH
jgi:hypothetical protein